MSLMLIATDGTETGATAAKKINNAINATANNTQQISTNKLDIISLNARTSAVNDTINDLTVRTNATEMNLSDINTRLSDYYIKTQTYNKAETKSLVNTKQDNLVSGTNIKTINGQSVLGSGDITIEAGGSVDLSDYYKKTETYSKVEVDTKIADIPPTDLTNYYNKAQVDAIALDKVDKVVGKQLSTEDYTTAEKTKLSGLSNYVKPISEPISYIDGLQTALDDKVDKVSKQALDSSNALRVSGTTVSLYKGDGTFDSITTQDTIYTLPTATSTVNGGIELFSDTVQTVASNSVSTTDGRTYGIQLNSAGQAVVNVPWSDTNTVYTHPNSGVTAGTYSKVTVNTQGHITNGSSLLESDIPNLDASKITTGTIDAARLPSFVDDVLEFANLAGFPTTGETGKIYIALDTNKTYRWGGTSYVYITSGAVDSVAGKTGVVTLNKDDVGLNQVNNTSDVDKPISTATANALALKTDTATLESLNAFRADKVLASKDVANLIYSDGNLVKIRYTIDDDVDYEVLTYSGEDLTNVAHYLGGVLQGNTMLTYSGGNLVSSIFVGV